MEHEREPLGGAQRLEHHQQRETDGVGQQCLVLGVGAVRAVDDRLGDVHVQRLLAPRPARTQHAQRHSSDHGGQPRAKVLDLVRIRAAEPQPGFLHSVVGLAHRAEHPVGDRAQTASVLLEALRQPVSLFHGHIPPSRWVIEVDPPERFGVTSSRRRVSNELQINCRR